LHAAIGAAHPGDTIIVASGLYPEHGLVIDKPLTLIGRGWPRIDGQNSGQIITIQSDSVHIEGFVIENVGLSYMEDRAGIKLLEVKHCEIRGNRLLNNFFAIYLENSGDCLITDNHIAATLARETTSGNGIHLWYCRDITIENNSISGHRDGIYFEFVEDSVIRGNNSVGNLRYGLHFMFSHRDVYTNNLFEENGAGVAVMFSDYVTMKHNRFVHNWGSASYGLLLKDIRDSSIQRNEFVNNTIGVYSEGSIRLDLRHNDFKSNGYAIKVMSSSTDNVITRNNFIGNTFDISTNGRHNFNDFTGNYWSRYQGYDLDRDGIGDVPYRPVHLFSLLVEREPAGLVLLRSFFIDLIDAAERIMPVYTPPTLMDAQPSIAPIRFDADVSPVSDVRGVASVDPGTNDGSRGGGR
jgi:nitrous oxidase accessory protein